MEIIYNNNSNQASNNTLRNSILQIKAYLRYLVRKWYVYLIVFLIAIGIAYYFYKNQPNAYVAYSTFVVDDPAAASQMPNIPGGFLGGLIKGNNNSLFQGENLKWLYTTNLMLSNTLLSKNPATDRLFINEFLDYDPKIKKIIKNKKYEFTYNYDFTNQEKNKVINDIITIINKHYLSVSDVNSTGLAVKVQYQFPNEIFSKEFVIQLVTTVNNNYVKNKTKSKEAQVAELQKKAEEYNSKLNRKIAVTAEQIQSVPFPNPNLPTAQAPPQRTRVDVDLNTQLYSQAVAALENAKVELQELKPLINVVDSPILPLRNNKKTLPAMLIVSLSVSFLLTTLILVLIYSYKKVMTNVI